jgi:heme A synthase
MRINRLGFYAWAVVALNLVVVLWGVVVRATGSGAGCGSHWPLCNGVVVPLDPTVHTVIEFTHRLTSGLDVVAVVLLWLLVRLRLPRGHQARLWASLTLFFIFTEALIGAALVLLGLAVNHPHDPGLQAGMTGLHLINTFLLLASATLAARAVSGGGALQFRPQSATRWLLLLSLVMTLLLGASGAIAALGDTLFPVSTLAAGLRQDFSPTTNILLHLRVIHPALALVVAVLLFTVAARAASEQPDPEVLRWSTMLRGLVLLQVLAGAVNLLLAAPIAMQLIHLLLADLLWLSAVLLWASVLARPLPQLRFREQA